MNIVELCVGKSFSFYLDSNRDGGGRRSKTFDAISGGEKGSTWAFLWRERIKKVSCKIYSIELLAIPASARFHLVIECKLRNWSLFSSSSSFPLLGQMWKYVKRVIADCWHLLWKRKTGKSEVEWLTHKWTEDFIMTSDNQNFKHGRIVDSSRKLFLSHYWLLWKSCWTLIKVVFLEIVARVESLASKNIVFHATSTLCFNNIRCSTA